MIKLGERVGAYTFLRELGRGGMGTVYLADDHDRGKRCAIKVLHPHLVHDTTVIERFRSEVRVAAAIQHHAIVAAHSIAQLPDDGPWYYVMDYVEGPTLTEFCRARNEPLSPGLVLEILGPIFEAFDLIHAAKFVHRDLKPDNILIVTIGGRRFPRVLDFGIAKRIDQVQGLTRPGNAPGTAAYMAPEQARGDAVDRTCDIYSIGVVMFWMLTGGRFPYEVPDDLRYHAVMSHAPSDPRRYATGLSDDAANVILCAIHPDPTRRPRSMGTLGLMFARAVVSDGIYPDGAAILKSVAPQLLIIGNLDETFRAPGVKALPTTAAWKYEYGAQLGRGGMAEVYRATLRGEGGFALPRAIKVILPEFASSPDFERMLREEARVAALLVHRNIVGVTDHDIDPKGRLYIAMEFVDGPDLERVRESGRLPPTVANFILSEILQALEYAHDLPPTSPLASAEEIAARGDARGIVHRDISHHNVLLSWDGEVKLSDFGIAKLRTSTSADGSRMIKGKPSYMSPEQASGAVKLDGRSDLWALGVMLWELLTGQRLFNQENTMAILAAVGYGDIPHPRVVCPDIPADLDAITMRLLQRDLSQRFQTAREVRDALRASGSASADGRDELLHLLAARFPERARPVSGHRASGWAQPSADPWSAVGSSHPGSEASWQSQGSWQASSTTGHTAGQALEAPSGARAWRGLAAGGAALAAVVTLGFAIHAGRNHDRATPPKPAASVQEDAPATPAMVLTPAARAAAPPPTAADVTVARPKLDLVTVRIDTVPSGAHLELRTTVGPISGHGPLSMSVPARSKIQLEAHLDGYTDATQSVEIDGTTTNISVPLIPAAQPQSPSVPPPRSEPPARGPSVPRSPAPKAPRQSPAKEAEPSPGIIE